MKRILHFAIASIVLFTSCSKNNGPAGPDGSVSINGSKYGVVKIGTQTWTVVNYNGPGGNNYNDGPNDPTYGKLYTFAEAQAVPLPSGWRLPTRADYNTLFISLGGEALVGAQGLQADVIAKLMSTSTWTYNVGTNSSGWDAVGAGIYDLNIGPASHYLNKGYVTVFYTSDLSNVAQNVPYVVSVVENPDSFSLAFDGSTFGNDNRLSIRFVKDN